MSDDREQAPGGSYRDDDGLALAVAVGLACLLVLPLAAAWVLARPAAAHRWAWRRVGWRGRRGIVAAWVLLVCGVLAWAGWLTTGPGLALAVVAGWAVMVPAGWLVFRLRLSLYGSALRAGALPPRSADRVRRAIWQAADADAYARTGWRVVDGQPRAVVEPGKDAPGGCSPAGRRVLGVVVDDDRRHLLDRLADSTGRRSTSGNPWQDGPYLVMPAAPPRAVLLGDSGSGKTTALRAMTTAALLDGWRVLVLDGKGSPEDAADLAGIARALGLPAVEYPRQPFDLWRGDASTVARLAAALLPHDGAQHYRDRDAGNLAAVASRGPWRSTADLLDRLRIPAPHVDRATLAALVQRSEGVPSHMATYGAVLAALAPLAGLVDRDGWGLDDADGWRLAVASLDAGANPAAPVMGAAMLASLDAYRVARRSRSARPLLVLVDEAGVMLDHPAAPPVARLAEQLRSAGIGLVVAGQSPHSLGEQADRLLSSGAALLTMRSAEPEAVITRVGTVRAAEVAHQGAAGLLTGVTAAREQAQHALDPDRVRALTPWRVEVWQPGAALVRGLVPPVEHPADPGRLPRLREGLRE